MNDSVMNDSLMNDPMEVTEMDMIENEPTNIDDKTRESILKKLYNAKKAKKSYEKKKAEISKRRALINLEKGKAIKPSTIKEHVLSEEEKLVMNNYKQGIKDSFFVPIRSSEYIREHKDEVEKQSKGRYTLMEEDNTSDDYIFTREETHGYAYYGEQAIQYIVNNDLLTKRPLDLKKNQKERKKTAAQKKLAIKNYNNQLEMIRNIYGSQNLLEIYTNPERFFNKLLTSHLSISSIKQYASLLVTLLKHKSDEKAISIETNQPHKLLQDLVLPDQAQKFSEFVIKGISLSKEEEVQKVENAPYYKWEDFKRIEELISRKKRGIQGLRDHVIARMYIRENALRDNLGLIKVVTKDLPEIDESNYLNIKTGLLRLKDFKTNKYFKNAKVYLGFKTLLLIREYLYEMDKITGKTSQYLITKDNGELYKDGKLSRYIIDMFKRYTGAENVSINDMRHSVATYHMRSKQRIKEHVAEMLHHSYKQHINYERHSNNHLKFPLLEQETNVKKDPFIDETVIIITKKANNDVILIMGMVESKKTNDPNDNTYIVKFHNRNLINKEYQLPNEFVVVM